MNLSESFSLLPTSSENVLKLLEEMNTSKATGLDNIAGRFLKDGATALAEPLTELCNLSILQSKFPDGCKLARLKPLFKKDRKMTSKTIDQFLCFRSSQKLLKNHPWASTKIS